MLRFALRNRLRASLFRAPKPQVRLFASANKDDLPEIEYEPTQEELQEMWEDGYLEQDPSESKELIAQYHLVPVAEHPLFPGSSQALSVTQEQYEILKDNQQLVFASDLRNDEILKSKRDMLQQMLNPSASQESSSDITLPNITSLDDIYETGVLCEARVFEDKQNDFLPYVLNLFPQKKAVLMEGVGSEVGPLMKVLA